MTPFVRNQGATGLAVGAHIVVIGRGDDKVGNPHRAQISQFELFELILLLKLDENFPGEQFEATVSQRDIKY